MTLTLLNNLTALLPSPARPVIVQLQNDQITAAFELKSDNPYWVSLSEMKYINIQYIFL